MLSIATKIKASAAAFHDQLWPLIADELGGGRIVHVESVSDQDFFKQVLDCYSGIDTWHVDDANTRVRGLATRMQKTRVLFDTFTIRFRRESGRDTEYHKRLKTIQSLDGWLKPSVSIQGYFHPDGKGGFGQPRQVLIARTDDLIEIIHTGKQGQGYDSPNDWYVRCTDAQYGHDDETLFAVIPIGTLQRQSYWYRFIKFPLVDNKPKGKTLLTAFRSLELK